MAGRTKQFFSVLLVFVLLCGMAGLLGVPASATTEGVYTFTITGGNATINSVDFAASGVLNIPLTLGGAPVTSIAAYAFGGRADLTEITIPEGVLSIGESAFAYCSKLESVSIPSSVTSIGNRAFYVCSGLESIDVAPANTAYVSDGGVLFNIAKTVLIQYPPMHARTAYSVPAGVTEIKNEAFQSSINLESAVLPAGVLTIGDNGFNGSGIKTISLPDSLTQIGIWAFADCKNLLEITIPANVSSIGEAAFYSCRSLPAIQTNPDNTNFCSVDGVLFNKSKTELIAYPVGSPATSYAVPVGVTKIAPYAFGNNNTLTTVLIPEGVTSIGKGAFSSTRMQTIVLPDSVTEIGEAAFAYSHLLTSIHIPPATISIGKEAFYNYMANVGITVCGSATGSYAEDYTKKTELGSTTKFVFDPSPCTGHKKVTLVWQDAEAGTTYDTWADLPPGKTVTEAAALAPGRAIPVPVKPGYTFNGFFYKNGNPVAASDPLQADTAYPAGTTVINVFGTWTKKPSDPEPSCFERLSAILGEAMGIVIGGGCISDALAGVPMWLRPLVLPMFAIVWLASKVTDISGPAKDKPKPSVLPPG